jgi:tetratricopeptide (TPR) repeat protein
MRRAAHRVRSRHCAPRVSGGRPVGGVLLLAGVLALGAAACAATQSAGGRPVRGTASAAAQSPPPAAAPTPPLSTAADTARIMALLQIADNARRADDRGDPEAALAAWLALRPKVPLDCDLELAVALDEARTGRLDSAAVRLSGRVLSAAAADTLPVERYLFARQVHPDWMIDGRFSGWHWYVWRARSEVAASRGRWSEATDAARHCVQAQPTSGKQWLQLAVCAGRAGLADEARAAARQAARLDPGVPEAHYLNALWAWKDGRRADAQAGFRAAVAQDSAFRPAAVALVRSRLPGSAPDTLPATGLTGPRAAGLLTSRAYPKLENEIPVDQVPILAHRAHPAVPDSLKAMIGDRRLRLWLYVDEGGQVPLVEAEWVAGSFPASVVAELMGLIPVTWRFLPANIKGVPRAMWVDVNYSFPR